MADDVRDALEVEWLILADAAQVSGDKLYLLGGGWDVLTVNSAFPFAQLVAIAASFRVPWNDTNQAHAVEIEVMTDDGTMLAKMGGQVEVGRPPGIPAGSVQRAQIAVGLNLSFERPGGYVINARVGGGLTRSVPFRVVPGPGLLMQEAFRQGPPPAP